MAVAAAADCSGPTKAQVLEPVGFGLNRHEIDPAQFPVIDKALAAVRARPCEVLLLKAHTDTSGEERINIDLARRRAVAVRDLLVARGGLAGNRVLMAELPRNDLPKLHARWGAGKREPHGGNDARPADDCSLKTRAPAKYGAEADGCKRIR